MEPVKRSEVVDLTEYERIRADFRAQAMAEKDRRRVQVGPHLSFLFENRLTVLYQVQEMLRVERIVSEDAIAHELQTYNELLPPPGGLGASLLIQYEAPAVRDQWLARLVGLHQHVWLRLEGLPAVPGEFDTRQMGTDRISAVQYVQFRPGPDGVRFWEPLGQSGGIRLAVDHPAYRHETVLSPELAAALGQDLAA
jgi:hypothetical protein